MILNIVNKIIEDDLRKQFPPSSQNNSRSIVRNALERFYKSPSDSAQSNIEELTGWTGDHRDEDNADYDLIAKKE